MTFCTCIFKAMFLCFFGFWGGFFGKKLLGNRPGAKSLWKMPDAHTSSLQLSNSTSGYVSACLFPCVLSSAPGSRGSLVLHKHLIRINSQLDAASFSPPPWRRANFKPTLSRAQREIFVPESCPPIAGRRPAEPSLI